MRIVFMGTPEFAVPSLKILVEHDYDVVGVITATDKRGGRGGKKLIESAVKKYAVEQGLYLMQPPNLKNPDFLEELRSLKADLQVVVAFRMLPVAVWDMPPLGTLNLHGSLLPRYRGAAPLNWAIINGEQQTGLTTFFLKHAIDTGDLLFQYKTPIGEEETVGELHDRLMHRGAELMLKTIRGIEKEDCEAQEQDESLVSAAPKIFHKDCKVDFSQTTQQVHDFVRGLSPYPTAWTRLDGQKLKLYKTKRELEQHNLPIGTIDTDDKNYLRIATQDGFVHILELQLQGRKRMDTSDFLNGYTLAVKAVES